MSALSRRGILTLKRPVVGGVVVNWDDWEKMVHDTFYSSLRVAPEEHALLMLLSPAEEAKGVQKVIQILFETFMVPRLLILRSDVAALFPHRSGLVLNASHDSMTVSAVVDGVSRQAIKVEIGGWHVREDLRSRLSPDNRLSDAFLEEIKTKLCFVSPVHIDSLRQMWAAEGKTRTIMTEDNVSVGISSEVFEAPEVLFANNALVSTLFDLSSRFGMTNLTVMGKTSLLPGFVERLSNEMLLQHRINLTVFAPRDRGGLDWKNASLIASMLDESNRLWMRREYYDEVGPEVVWEQWRSVPIP